MSSDLISSEHSGPFGQVTSLAPPGGSLHGFIAARLPSLPTGCVDGVGARVGDVLVCGLGSAGRHWYALDLATPESGWVRCADFPAGAPTCAVGVALMGKIYVFGGFGRMATNVTTTQFDTAHCYDPQADRWELLPTRLPVGLTGASAVAIDASTICFFGGYNRQQFDDFHRDYETASGVEALRINDAYMDRPVQAFAWNTDVWSFDVSRTLWSKLPAAPHWPNCKSAIVIKGHDLYLFGGEVKPGLRATTVKHAKFGKQGIDWQSERALPPVDGLAGAFAGVVGEQVIAAGGTNFPGAWARYRGGQYFAHEGLTKTWCSDIYRLDGSEWRLAGHLPCPRANGLCFEVNNGLLIVGGDTQGGQPCLDTWWLPPMRTVSPSWDFT